METLRGPEKWLAIAETQKKLKKEMKKIQTTLLQRNSGLTNSTSRSQYFIDKYPLIEKTRAEREKIIEERKNAPTEKTRLIIAR